MKKNLILLLAVALCLPVFAGPKSKAKKDTEHYRYELECAGNGVQGTYLIKVWSYSRKAAVAAEQCKKNAVHGVIFKGYTGETGCVAQRPLAKIRTVLLRQGRLLQVCISYKCYTGNCKGWQGIQGWRCRFC